MFALFTVVLYSRLTNCSIEIVIKSKEKQNQEAKAVFFSSSGVSF